jgi:hypothetical protein
VFATLVGMAGAVVFAVHLATGPPDPYTNSAVARPGESATQHAERQQTIDVIKYALAGAVLGGVAVLLSATPVRRR